MNDFLGDDDDMEDSSINNFSGSINELLDTSKKLEFEAVDTIASNENAWNSSLSMAKSKAGDHLIKHRNTGYRANETKKMELSINSATFKAPRNPRKVLLKLKSSSQIINTECDPNVLPDLETILLEKSRATNVLEATRTEVPENEIKTQIDSNWLNRNLELPRTETPFNLTTSSSFGLSNLIIEPSSSLEHNKSRIDNSVEVKFHSCEISDNEYVIGNENKNEMLPISKKRKISDSNYKATPNDNNSSFENKRITGYHYNTDDDDDTKEHSINKGDRKEKSPSPEVMKRKKSLIKRSREGITKVTRKASKLLSRSKKNEKLVEEAQKDHEEENINYFIDTELSNVNSVPRMSEKFLDQSEKLIQNFVFDNQGEQKLQSTLEKPMDHKTTLKKEALSKKISTGTLNENYVRVNLKKKVFVRGKKAFNFSRYKKTIWKSKKQAQSLNDMRGCDGGVLRCFNCDGVGHFAQQCKKKGDNLLPMDVEIEEESSLPTLEEAAQMAENQKALAHAKKSNSNAWTTVENIDNLNKENKDVNFDAQNKVCFKKIIA